MQFIIGLTGFLILLIVSFWCIIKPNLILTIISIFLIAASIFVPSNSIGIQIVFLVTVLIGIVNFFIATVFIFKIAFDFFELHQIDKGRLIKRIVYPSLIFLVALGIWGLKINASKEADKFLTQTAREVQQQCKGNKKCPKSLMGWEGKQLLFKKYGDTFNLYYNSEDEKSFSITLSHDIDSGIRITGGVEKDLNGESYTDYINKPYPIK